MKNVFGNDKKKEKKVYRIWGTPDFNIAIRIKNDYQYHQEEDRSEKI